jgi:hypothetical protein
MTMSKQAFDEHREKEGWSDAEDDSKEESAESLTFGTCQMFALHFLLFCFHKINVSYIVFTMSVFKIKAKSCWYFEEADLSCLAVTALIKRTATCLTHEHTMA